MFAETIFFSSFAGIAFMLGTKLVQERFGTFDWWTTMATWADQKVHAVMATIADKYKLYKKIAGIFFFEFLPAYIYHSLVKMKDYMYRKYYASAGNLKGEKRMLRSNGTVSEFLQTISKEKGSHESIDNSQ